eukprot:scaffold1046_cov162-Ochromonas_danica.AAC.12
MSRFAKLLNPYFYVELVKAQAKQIVENTSRDMRNNSIRPLFKFMAVYAFGGYALNYYFVESKIGLSCRDILASFN